MNTMIVIILLIARLWVSDMPAKGQQNLLQGDFRALTAALQVYRLNAGVYPSTEQGLGALVARPDASPLPRRWTQIMLAVAKDPWGSEYQYKLDEGEVKLWSKGPNIKDPKDDIHFPPKKKVEPQDALQ